MAYIENRLVHDADAHIMETPNWLSDYADPDLRQRIKSPGYVNELRQIGDNESQLEDIDAAFAPIHTAVDHHCLNEVEGLENPTSELLAQWIWQRLAPRLAGLVRVVVRETCDSGCIYDGP